jgi:hypothetical protein
VFEFTPGGERIAREAMEYMRTLEDQLRRERL